MADGSESVLHIKLDKAGAHDELMKLADGFAEELTRAGDAFAEYMEYSFDLVKLMSEEMEKFASGKFQGNGRPSRPRRQKPVSNEGAGRQSITQFRKIMRARVQLVEEFNGEYDRVSTSLDEIIAKERKRLEIDNDNVEAAERLLAAKRALKKVNKAVEPKREAERRVAREREYGRIRTQEIKSVSAAIDALEKKVESAGVFESWSSDIQGARKQIETLKKRLSVLQADNQETVSSLIDQEKQQLASRLRLVDAEEDENAKILRGDKERVEALRRMVTLQRQLRAEQEGLSMNARRGPGSQGGAGRRAVRNRMKQNGTFASYNAALQASRLVQDAPFGLIGIVNNIDMALDALQKLRKQAGSTSKALRQLFFGAGAASGMLWVNALMSGYLILDNTLGISEQISAEFEGLAYGLLGAATSEMKKFREEVEKAALGAVELGDFVSEEQIERQTTAYQTAIDALREQRGELKRQLLVQSLLGRRESGPGAPDRGFFGTRTPELDAEIERIEKLKQVWEDAQKEIGARNEALARQEEGVISKAHGKVLEAMRSFNRERLEIMLEGRDERKDLQERLIRAEGQAKIQEYRRQMIQVAAQIRAAVEAGNSGAEATFRARLQQLIVLLHETDKAIDRQVEDLYETEEKSKDILQELFDLRKETERAEIEAMEDSLAKKQALIDHELRYDIGAMEKRLEEFEGTQEQRREFAALVERWITARFKQAEREKTEATREHEEKRMEIRMRAAQRDLEVERQRLQLGPSAPGSEIERSRLETQERVLELSHEIALAERDADFARIARLEEERRVTQQLHQQRVAEIRREAEARKAEQEAALQDMIFGANEERQRLQAEATQGYLSAARDRRQQLIQIEEQGEMRRLQETKQAEMQRIQELEDASEDTLANEVRFYAMRMDLLEWFLTEKGNIEEYYRQERERAEEEHRIRMMRLAGQYASQRLADLSAAAQSTRRLWIARRRAALIDEGKTEREATKQAKEEAKKRFEYRKGLAIAEGMVNTYNAALQVYANSPGGLVGKIAAVGAAITFGLKTVAKIREMEYGAAGTGGGLGGVALGSSTYATGPQFRITDTARAGLPGGYAQATGESALQQEVAGLREDMAGYQEAIEKRPVYAQMSRDTAVEANRVAAEERAEKVR